MTNNFYILFVSQTSIYQLKSCPTQSCKCYKWQWMKGVLLFCCICHWEFAQHCTVSGWYPSKKTIFPIVSDGERKRHRENENENSVSPSPTDGLWSMMTLKGLKYVTIYTFPYPSHCFWLVLTRRKLFLWNLY